MAWNVAATRAFGWEAADVLGAPTPFATAGARAILARVAAGAPIDDAHPIDLPFVARDGSPRRALLRAAPRGDGGGVVFVDGSGVDRAELERHEPFASSPFQTVLDAIPTPIWFKTVDGIYRGCNLAFERAIGKTREEIVGRTVESAGPKDLATVYRDADRSLFESGGTQVYEGELRRADGIRRKVQFHKAAFRDHAGKVIGLAGALVDIGDLRRTEEDLRRALALADGAESRFADLVEATPDLIVIHREGRILFVNPAMGRIVGHSAAELAGTAVLDWIHPEDRADLADRMGATGTLPPAEGRLVGEGGRATPVEFISVSLQMEDGPVRVAIGRDLTERKRAEEQLQRSDRLASLGTLAAGVAHELNNPLSFVLANAEWAIERIRACCTHGGAQLDEVIGALDDVVQGAQRMKVIVSDLRTAARDETATETLAAVDVGRVVEFAAQLTRAEIRRCARLEVEVEEAPLVFGSETRLAQVLVNLLVNAAQAFSREDPARNHVRIRLATAPDGAALLEVTDNGAGIPDAVRPHLFEPFFTTKPVGEGTGLGLWVSHGIVTAHGGEIAVESAPGEGSTFRIRLPALSEERAAPAPQKSFRKRFSFPAYGG